MRRLQADVFPAYGHKLIDTITAADIRELMIAVEARDARMQLDKLEHYAKLCRIERVMRPYMEAIL